MTEKFPSLSGCTIAVIGLGYVGLPLLHAFLELFTSDRAKYADFNLIGFDTNISRISQLLSGVDLNRQISSPSEFAKSRILTLTAEASELSAADVFIVTVPTPVDSSNIPDLSFLKAASETVGEALRSRHTNKEISSSPVIVYESTVFPGATQDFCVPLIESTSGLTYNYDFYVGYSPERINPGDETHTLSNIVKIVSGSTPKTTSFVNSLYSLIVKAGTHLAPSILVAECAKIIENTQRDINIALINELSTICHLLGVKTSDVIEAACTKWNFLPFYPGLVGGHCIGVDPYYLTYKAQLLGYHPEVVLSGRRINDSMPFVIADRIIQSLAKRRLPIGGNNVLILGFSFKENCPDIRNTKVYDLVTKLSSYGLNVTIYDPTVNPESVYELYNLSLASLDEISVLKFVVIIAAVAHDCFYELDDTFWFDHLCENGILFDVKGVIPKHLDPMSL